MHHAGEQLMQVGPGGSEPRFFMRAKVEHDRARRWNGISLDPPSSGRKAGNAMRRLEELGAISAPLNLRFEAATTGTMAGALLAWAYLLWFEHLGYAFATQPSQRRLRHALLTDDVDSLGRATVGWRSELPTTWERGRPVLVGVRAARAIGLGWEWPSVATAVLARADDSNASIYDLLDDAAEEVDKTWELTTRAYPVLEGMRFGFPAAGPPPPSGSPVLVDGRVRLAGATLTEALSELSRPLEPVARPRPKRRRPTPASLVPALARRVAPSRWHSAAVSEAKRVAAEPASITSEVAAKIGTVPSLPPAEREALWRELGVDAGVAAHLRDLWRYAVDGESYDPEADDRINPDNVTFLVRGVPRDHRPDIRTINARIVQDDPQLCATWLVWEIDQGPEVVGPFYSATALLAAIRVRTRAMRQELSDATEPSQHALRGAGRS